LARREIDAGAGRFAISKIKGSSSISARFAVKVSTLVPSLVSGRVGRPSRFMLMPNSPRALR
jgi:hypothetical protein